MIKIGEKYICSHTKWKQYLRGASVIDSRQRLIFVPQGEAANGLLTMMQRVTLRALKKVCPSFCHSVSCVEMAEHIQNQICQLEGDIRCICTDGSNHDGHQDLELIKAVDWVFFDTLFDEGWMRKVLSNYDVQDFNYVKQVLRRCIYETVAKIKFTFQTKEFDNLPRGLRNRKYIRHITYIRGTTFSGSAVRTTLGNTLRVIMYWHFIAHNLGYTARLTIEDHFQADVFIYVSGDDQAMWSSVEKAEKIEENYLRWMSPDKDEKEHGLGQCVTEFSVRKWDDIDFCSKVSYSYDGNLVILRDPKKILMHSSYHRFMSDLGYMPPEMHSLYVGESILHELPGELCKAYGEMRRDLGRVQMKESGISMAAYRKQLKSIYVRRKPYNITKKNLGPHVDKHMARFLGLNMQQYLDIISQCLNKSPYIVIKGFNSFMG